MSFDATRQALDTRLKTYADSASLPVAFENYDDGQDQEPPYLSTALLAGQPSAATLGQSGQDLRTGIYQVNVYGMRGKGTGPILAIADALAAQFSRGLALVASGVTTQIRRAWPGPAYADGDHYVIPVSVSWFCYV